MIFLLPRQSLVKEIEILIVVLNNFFKRISAFQ